MTLGEMKENVPEGARWAHTGRRPPPWGAEGSVAAGHPGCACLCGGKARGGQRGEWGTK